MAFVSQDGKAPLPDPISHTVTAMMAAYAASRKDEERPYLGASEIGAECERALWYSFRWASPLEKKDGRVLWLLDTGHLEEGRMVAALKATPGIDVQDRDGEGQIGFSAGHFRGHLDGIVTGLLEAPATPHVLECKTHNEKSFKATQKHGVVKEKPQHAAQMQIYMHMRGLERALYLFENKNTSELATERLEYDPAAAGRLVTKAERIVEASRPLPKLHEDPSAKVAFACTFCRHRAVCHDGLFARLNCRTCLHATPTPDGGWWCEKHETSLDIQTQRAGCSAHLYIPDLVPGEQVDADLRAETVTYKLTSGSLWIDGATA